MKVQINFNTNQTSICNSNVKAMLTYGSETWRTTQFILQKIQFLNLNIPMRRRILRPETMSNEALWERTNQEPIALAGAG